MKNTLILPAALLSTALLLSACSNATDSASADTSTAVQIVETTDTQTMTVATEMDAATKMNAAMVTKTKAVLIYADWCSSCKILDPKVKAVQAMGDMPGLDYVTLDYTDKNPANFYAQAADAGVEAAVRAELDGTIKTGWLLLVDIDDQRVLSKVTKSDDAAQIVTKLKDALAAS